jgi:hypothetical protein
MMSTRHFLIAIATGISALAFGVPLAGAGDTPVDDYWRDQSPVAASTDTPADTLVDDYFRDVPVGVAAQSPTADHLVDDYFRDSPTIVTAQSDSFDWGDFGIGIATAMGTILLLVGLALAILAVRPSAREKRHSAGMA